MKKTSRTARRTRRTTRKGGMKKAERDAKINEIANGLIAKIKKDEITRHEAVEQLSKMRLRGNMEADVYDKIKMEVGINYPLK